MSFEDALENLWFFDFEVYAHDWLLVLIRYKDDKEIIFHNSLPDDVQDFLDEYRPILLGHNAKYYDQYILKAVLSGFNEEEIKDVNDYIINGGQGFELQYSYVNMPPIWDTIQDVVPMRSLKEIEANLRLNITETKIPFNLPSKWTKKEYEEVLYYCRHDVMALKPLFNARYGYFETKYNICMLSRINLLYNTGLTNAKLCAKFLNAKLVKRDDEREYTVPSVISVELIDKKILNFFSRIKDKNIPSEELFTSRLEYDFHGMPSNISWGGLHGAKLNFTYNHELEKGYIVINADFSSLYPHLLALPEYNFISRNIANKNVYFDTLKERLELKKKGITKKQKALKLILNTTYGCQNNEYNDLYDPRMARGTCITGQLLISELTERIYAIGDVELVQLNTDGLMVKLPEDKLDEYYKVSEYFSKKCGIGLEYDKIYKIVQRDVNNYCMLYGDEKHKKIKAKGGCFSALPDINIKDDGTLDVKVINDFKANSLSIVAEAILKKLLFDIPVEKTINDCDDIFRFQMVSHLGSTYEKCVQESLNNDINIEDVEKCKKELYNLEEERDKILDNLTNNANDIECYNIEDLYDSTEYKEISSKINNINMKISSLLHPNDIVLQRNNRIYAGKKPSGIVVKIKSDGRRDSLANCPPNPIIDNANECTIDDINKEWYIDLAKQRVNDFLGIKRIEDYKKDELLNKAKDYGLEIDKKTKKSELIKIIKEYEKRNEVDKMATKQELEEKLQKSVEQNEQLMEKLKEQKSITANDINDEKLCNVSLLHKINEFRKKIRERKFTYDEVMPNNLGGKDYYSIDQFYNAVQDCAIEVGLDFTFNVTNVISFDKELVKPSGSSPKHVATVETKAILTDIDTGKEKIYTMIAQGSDTIDKAVTSASSIAFRNWFYKNFTPKEMKEKELDDTPEEQSKPKVPVYIPESKKEEIKKEVVQQVQHEDSDDEDIKAVCENIMKIRDLTGDDTYGTPTLNKLMSGTLSSVDILEIDLKVKQKLKKVQNG